MRLTLVLVTLIATNVAYPGQPTPQQTVFSYECQQIAARLVGFSCHYQPGQFVLQMHERFSEMSPERRERAQYEFDKISLRFFELGGASFDVTADFWASNTKRRCAHRKGKPFHMFACYDYTPEE